MDERTVEISVTGATWIDDDLVRLSEALGDEARLLDPSVGANLKTRVITVLVTVRADTDKDAHAEAQRAIGDALFRLGLAPSVALVT
jgi:hypothetical protein